MTPNEAHERASAHLLTSARIKQRTAEQCLDSITAAAALIADALRAGGKLLLCGNGGSAADCQHIASEFTNRYRVDLARPGLAALALTTDTSFITSHANDFAYASLFRRQIEALGKPGDVLLAISTGGNSENVILAAQAARAGGLTTIGLTAGTGGRLRPLVDLAVIVPSDNTQHAQEVHITIGHIIADLVERALFDPPATGASLALS